MSLHTVHARGRFDRGVSSLSALSTILYSLLVFTLFWERSRRGRASDYITNGHFTTYSSIGLP